jgi:hypothetical protein
VGRKKVVYPPAKTASRGASAAAAAADARAAAAASRSVSINLQAIQGRSGITQGGRVQIMSGLYAGEFATVESLVSGVIPAAVVRTDAGRSRRARTVDLVPVQPGAGDKANPGVQPAAEHSAAPDDPQTT